MWVQIPLMASKYQGENMSENSFERVFGKTAQTTVLENLIQNRDSVTYISGIAEETGLSNSSVARVLQPLVKSGIVTEGQFGKMIKTYSINKESEAARLIFVFYNDLELIFHCE